MNPEYARVVTQTGRPIPGQSLTLDPDNPQPYEKPPQYTSIHEASEFIFQKLISEETYPQIMGLMLDDMPIMEIAQTLLFKGFVEGKWTPDLMLMLVEPVAYMLLALAERAQIDPVIYRDEDEDDLEEEEVFGTAFEKEKVERLRKFLKTKEVPANTLTPEMVEQIEQLPVPSLLSPPTVEEEQ